jgi:hypothetical protein
VIVGRSSVTWTGTVTCTSSAHRQHLRLQFVSAAQAKGGRTGSGTGGSSGGGKGGSSGGDKGGSGWGKDDGSSGGGKGGKGGYGSSWDSHWPY